jgi:hypothetical protein
MLATQLALAPMRRRGVGAVVNIASTGGWVRAAPLARVRRREGGLIRFTSSVAALREAVGVRVADAVVACIRDEGMAGRVMVLWRGAPRRLLDQA